MATPPQSTKTSLGQRLRARARERWPALTGVNVRYRGPFAYVDGQLADGTTLPLCRLLPERPHSPEAPVTPDELTALTT
ncbi:hypothetical protein FB561_6509 [Kribbella amoyensis]|uniref:Uncharacterized protein n=1 Tax=Kribbella amoyensis TaxID=996641 RepID=A0A561B899_9ACTN|nr:hypothetical protein FB561_6509 [Kribbella amoyensis]